MQVYHNAFSLITQNQSVLEFEYTNIINSVPEKSSQERLPVEEESLKEKCNAQKLTLEERKIIAIEALANGNISEMARRYQVSRKFITSLKEKASKCLNSVFSPSTETSLDADDEPPLFYIPVTKAWLQQVVVALVFLCKSSYQGIVEFFQDLLDTPISKGCIHNWIFQCLPIVKKHNDEQDLSLIDIGCNDEIYQAGDPVLGGVCAKSTYCYLLKLVPSCDANSWGVCLLDIHEKQGFLPNHTIIDGGQAARKGQEEALPGVPADGDTFHALKPFLELVNYAKNRADDTQEEVDQLTRAVIVPRGKQKEEESKKELIIKLIKAEENQLIATSLAKDLAILFDFLRKDIFAVIGSLYEDRKALLQYIIDELKSRESLGCSYRIAKVRAYLENHKENLLEFVLRIENKLKEIAINCEVSLEDVLTIYYIEGMSSRNQQRWENYSEWKTRMGQKANLIESLVEDVLSQVVRANSLVENLNSRLRVYFTLRRELGNDYLDFLQFFLNHRRFARSQCEERVGKSPRELLNGFKHKHWLEMLGFELFKQAA